MGTSQSAVLAAVVLMVGVGLFAGALGGLTGLYLQSALEWVLRQSINFAEPVIVFALISYLNEKADGDDRAKRRAKLAEREKEELARA